MGDILSFTLTSGIILLCLYLPYKLLLARENQHRLNRLILLGMYLLAIIVPLLKPVSFFVRNTDSTPSVAGAVANIEIGPLTGGIIESETPGWTRIVLWIYVIGMVITLCRFVWAYIKLSNIIRKGRKEKMDGYTLVITGDESRSPFSWRKYVVVGDKKDTEECRAVIVHELRHLSARHSMDLIIAQIYAIAVWYNPVSWLMIDELKTVHEYEADEAVIDSGVNLKEYQMLLIKKAVGTRLPSLANSLNHSKLQKRITMMYQSKSKMAGKFSSLALVPALAIGMAVVSIPAVASLISDASEASLVDPIGKITKNSADSEMSATGTLRNVSPIVKGSDTKTMSLSETVSEPVKAEDSPSSVETISLEAKSAAVASVAEENKKEKEDKDEVYVAVEKQAEFPGGIAAMMEWLGNNIRYPEEAYKADMQGRVIVKFVVNKDGSISDASILKSVSPSLDQEAVRVVMAMPKWAPAENNGKKVASYFHLPVVFKLTNPEPADTVKTQKK